MIATKPLVSFEIRKALRMKRKAALAALAANRPKPDEDDPADVAAVLDATKNMGDYKLKSAPDYEVPLEKQVDAVKKNRQMLLLEECLHTIQMGFNNRFLALRSLKKGVCLCVYVCMRVVLCVEGGALLQALAPPGDVCKTVVCCVVFEQLSCPKSPLTTS